MKQKERYSTPECESVRVTLESIIAASPEYSTTIENPFTSDTEEDW